MIKKFIDGAINPEYTNAINKYIPRILSNQITVLQASIASGVSLKRLRQEVAKAKKGQVIVNKKQALDLVLASGDNLISSELVSSLVSMQKLGQVLSEKASTLIVSDKIKTMEDLVEATSAFKSINTSVIQMSKHTIELVEKAKKDLTKTKKQNDDPNVVDI